MSRTSTTVDFTWRFLSANNRSMARSVPTFTDADACLAAIRDLRDRLPNAVGTTVRNGSGKWLWRISAEELDLATSGIRYERRLRARLACQAFVDLVATASADAVQVVWF
ncbi:hypothetical protein [Actinophytocola sp.]|uniref:hypothetical protein n=1 Tax=Actinophytocola sp. TaxID=1872138 RepID=UPI002ED11034